MPALVKRTVGSLAGTNESLGTTLCFFDSKNFKYLVLISSVVMLLLSEFLGNSVEFFSKSEDAVILSEAQRFDLLSLQ